MSTQTLELMNKARAKNAPLKLSEAVGRRRRGNASIHGEDRRKAFTGQSPGDTALQGSERSDSEEHRQMGHKGQKRTREGGENLQSPHQSTH